MSVYDSDKALVCSTASDDQGAWHVSGLPNGTYTIRATYIGTTSQAGKVEITIDRADLENVAIVLDGTTGGDDGDYTYEASGKVLDSNGQPAGGAVVYLWTADGGEPVGNTTAGDDGSYTFSGLANGTYQISVKYRYEGQEYTATGNAFVVYNANKVIPDVIVTVPALPEPGPEPVWLQEG